MKLSEAIRAGAAISEPTHGIRYKDGATCALGAAYLALLGPPADGIGYSEEDDRRFTKRFGISYWGQKDSQRLVNPEHGISQPPADIIIDLNDGHEWTREAIAEWLEGQGL